MSKNSSKRRRVQCPVPDEDDLTYEYELEDDNDPLIDVAPIRKDTMTTTSRNNRKNMFRQVERIGHGLPMVFVGCLSLLFFAMASILHIQTTEAFFLSIGHAIGFAPDWSVLSQPYMLFTGQYSEPVMAEAVMAGWIVEIAFLILTVSYDVLHQSLLVTSKRRAAWFRTAIYVLVALDGYSDFQYGNVATGFLGQFFFALLMAFAVLFLGTGGYHMVVRGLREWNRQNAQDEE